MANRSMTDEERQALAKYPVPPHFVAWLKGGLGRNAYFSRVDPALSPSVISKLMVGRNPITFEFAIRIERAQKPSDNPLKAEDLMTFKEDRELYQWLMDATAPMPEPSPTKFKHGMTSAQPRTVALEAQAGA